MAAPTYTTDLTTMVDFDGTPSSPSVAEPTGGWTAGRNPTASDTDFPIQSSTHASLTMNTTGKAGMLATNVSSFTWTSGDYLFGWITWLAPGAIATQASGGLAMICGSSASTLKVFYVGGSDWGKYPYGGWQNFAVDPEMTQDESIGTPGTDYDFVGAGANVLSAVSKGNPLGFDVFRYGRGELRVALGEAADEATFDGMATANDASSARWGLFQEASGIFVFKGLMILGYASAVTFLDANKNIVVDDMIYVQSDFNAIEIRNASSDVTWTNITISSLNSTSPGTLEVVDNATVSLTGCVFNDMSTFTFLSNTEALDCVFRRCDQVDAGGADLSGSTVEGYEGTADTAAVVWDVATDTDGLLDNMSFTKGTAATHAIELGTTSPLEVTFNGHSYSGYGADTTTSATVLVSRTAGTVTINVVGGDTPTYKSAGATVDIVVNPVSVSVHCTTTGGTDIQDVRVFLEASDGTGAYPYQDSVGLTHSAGTVTASHTAHGMATDDWVHIHGATEAAYNGSYQITVTGVDAYTYTPSNTPSASPATGSPQCTWVLFNELTSAAGLVSDTRTYSLDQPVSGHARKSSASPYYKESPLLGTISKDNGVDLAVQLVGDE